MDKAVEKVLRQLEKRADKEWVEMDRMDWRDVERNLDRYLLAVGPASGQLMNLLIKETKAKTIVEVGSSYGYSTVWLAEAARETGGKVISLEIHPQKQDCAAASTQFCCQWAAN